MDLLSLILNFTNQLFFLFSQGAKYFCLLVTLVLKVRDEGLKLLSLSLGRTEFLSLGLEQGLRVSERLA